MSQTFGQPTCRRSSQKASANFAAGGVVPHDFQYKGGIETGEALLVISDLLDPLPNQWVSGKWLTILGVLKPSIVIRPPGFVEHTVEIDLGFRLGSKWRGHPKSSLGQNPHQQTIEDHTRAHTSLPVNYDIVTWEPSQIDRDNCGYNVWLRGSEVTSTVFAWSQSAIR